MLSVRDGKQEFSTDSRLEDMIYYHDLGSLEKMDPDKVSELGKRLNSVRDQLLMKYSQLGNYFTDYFFPALDRLLYTETINHRLRQANKDKYDPAKKLESKAKLSPHEKEKYLTYLESAVQSEVMEEFSTAVFPIIEELKPDLAQKIRNLYREQKRIAGKLMWADPEKNINRLKRLVRQYKDPIKAGEITLDTLFDYSCQAMHLEAMNFNHKKEELFKNSDVKIKNFVERQIKYRLKSADVYDSIAPAQEYSPPQSVDQIDHSLDIDDEGIAPQLLTGDLNYESEQEPQYEVPDKGTSLVDTIINRSLCKATKNILNTMTSREEKVLRMRFGIGESQDHDLEETGRYFSVTRERIRQIESKALRKLRHRSRSRKLKPYVS